MHSVAGLLNRFMRYLYLPLALLCITACSNNGGTPDVDMEALPVVEIRATSDIEMPEPMTQTAFVPNYIAGWASHIVLLSETGNIWRTTTEGAPPRIISEGEYTDILGLSREGAAGAFLSLSQDGKLSAFIESDDDGNFQSIAVSYGGTDLKRFCAGPTDKAIWALGGDGSAYPLSASINGGMIAEISAGVRLKTKSAKSCYTGKNGLLLLQLDNGEWTAQNTEIKLEAMPADSSVMVLSDTHNIGVDAKTGHIFSANNNALSRIDIVNGLSIRGLEKAAFAAVTPYPMGSVFSDGLIVVGDPEEPRIVIISAAFAKQKLTQIPQ